MEIRIKWTWKKLKEVVEYNQKDGCKQTTKLIKGEIGITKEAVVGSNYMAKGTGRKKTMEYFKIKIEKEGKGKS